MGYLDHVPREDEGITVVRGETENGTHGFVIHESCWNLLQQILKSDDVPSHRLMEICESLPFTGLAINIFWGHTYNDLWDIEIEGYPWHGILSDPLYGSNVGKQALYDPFNVLEVSLMLTECSPTSLVLIINSQSTDCFRNLPWELREAIAIYLPTEEALGLRVSSRAFMPLWSSQTFWASRFKPGATGNFCL
jgi:hypothetical protein